MISWCEESEHDLDHGFAGFGGVFVVFAVMSAAAHPCEGAFDDPAHGEHPEAFGFGDSLHIFDREAQRLLNELRQVLANVGRVREDDAHSFELFPQSEQPDRLNAHAPPARAPWTSPRMVGAQSRA